MRYMKSLPNHELLVLWATDCAEHVLHYFEKENPKDDRPRKAIETARAWVRGEIKFKDARSAALAAHAAARDSKNPSARYAARSAGHAVATAHVKGHAPHAADYAVKAANNVNEREWQYSHLPERLRPLVKKMTH